MIWISILHVPSVPAIFYGCETYPCAEDQLAKLRSKTCDAILGASHSASPAIALLLASNSILDPAYFVLEQALRTARQWLSFQPDAMIREFFQIGTQFRGTNHSVKGPAAALKIYLQRIDWQLDSQGYLHVDPLIKLHLRDIPFSVLRKFLQLTWQQDLIRTLTNRHRLFAQPDISRCDTVQILNFPFRTKIGFGCCEK